MKNKFLTNFILSFNFFSLFHFNTNYAFLENKFFYLSLFFSFSTFYLFYKLNNFSIDYNNLDFNKLDYLKLIEFLTNKEIDTVITQKLIFLKSVLNLKYNFNIYENLLNELTINYYKLNNKDFAPKFNACTSREETIEFLKPYINSFVKLVQPTKPDFNLRLQIVNFSHQNLQSNFDFLLTNKALTLNSNPEFFLQITQHLLT